MKTNHPDRVTLSRADYDRLVDALYRDTNHALDSALRNEKTAPGVAEMCRKEAKKNAELLHRLEPDWPVPDWWP